MAEVSSRLSWSLNKAKLLETIRRAGSKFNHNYTSHRGLYKETCLFRGNSAPRVGTTLSIWHDLVYLNVPNLANCLTVHVTRNNDRFSPVCCLYLFKRVFTSWKQSHCDWTQELYHISNGTKTKTLTIRNSLFSHAMKYKMCSYPYQSQLLN